MTNIVFLFSTVGPIKLWNGVFDVATKYQVPAINMLKNQLLSEMCLNIVIVVFHVDWTI